MRGKISRSNGPLIYPHHEVKNHFKAQILFLLLVTLCFQSSSFASATTEPDKAPQGTFVEACLAQTQILEHRFVCHVKVDDNENGPGSELEVVLDHGTRVYVSGTGQFARSRKNLAVYHVRHLRAGMTTMGLRPESLGFYAEADFRQSPLDAAIGSVTGSRTLALMVIPCHQQDYAFVDSKKVDSEDELSEMTASCYLE